MLKQKIFSSLLVTLLFTANGVYACAKHDKLGALRTKIESLQATFNDNPNKENLQEMTAANKEYAEFYNEVNNS